MNESKSVLQRVVSLIGWVIVAFLAYHFFTNNGLFADNSTSQNPEEFFAKAETFFNSQGLSLGQNLNVNDSEYHPVDENGNIIVDVDMIVQEWTNHPFHEQHEEWLNLVTLEGQTLIESYQQGEIDIHQLTVYVSDIVEELHEYFYSSQFNLVSAEQLGVLLFVPEDVRYGLIAIEYAETFNPEFLYEILALDAYHYNIFSGMKPEEVSKYIIDFFNHNHYRDI